MADSDAEARAELRTLLDAQAARMGDRPLIVAGDRVTSARTLAALVKAKVRAYRWAGVAAGAVVGTVAWPPAEFVSDLFAIISAGATALPLPRRLSTWDMAELRRHITLTHVAAPPESALAGGPVATSVGDRALSYDHPVRPRVPPPAGAWRLAATAQITAGTTGQSRAALRSAAALLAEARSYRAAFGLSVDDVIACPVPLHHPYGFGLCALAAPLAGVSVHYLDVRRPRRLLDELRHRGPTLFVGVPPMLRSLAAAAHAAWRPARPIGFVSAGMSLDAHTAELVGTRLGGGLGQVYATTETGPICVQAPDRWATAVDSLGPPLPDVAVTLAPVDRDGGRECGHGVVTVRSPSMMLRYADDATTGRPPADGVVTGDLARWVDGGLALVGRVATRIDVAGVKVSPEKIEAAVLEFPEVSACVVVGVPDPLLGRQIAVVVTPASVDLDALERFCRQRLPPRWVPTVIRAVAALPPRRHRDRTFIDSTLRLP